MKLADYLHKEIGFSQEITQLIDNLFDNIELPKGQRLLKEGSQSKRVYYIEKGLIRVYYDKNGKDVTQEFFAEQTVFVPIEKVFLNQEFPYRVELLEDSTLRTAEFSQLEGYIEQNHELQHFVHYLMTYRIKQLADRLYSIQFQSAQERYKLLIETSPDILLRVSLGHIASYLGITQSTLSVIRGTKSK